MSHHQVLVIDDDQAILRVVEEVLESECEVKTAGCGAEALEALSRERPDVVLLDLRLPDIPGDRLASEIKALHPTLPIVVLSVVTETESVVRLMRAGSVEYLAKPFGAAELRTAVRRAIADGGAEDHAPLCESLLGVSPAMQDVQRRIAEAARDGRHVLLGSEQGFDVPDIARTLARLSGPRTLFLPFRAEETHMDLPPLPAHARGVVCFPLTEENPRGGVEALAAARGARFGEGAGKLQIVFDGSRLSPAGLRDAGLALPGVDVLHLPPLRERPEDIFLCLLFFLEKHARLRGRPIRSIALRVLGLVLSYQWPGNILEMDTVVAGLVRRGAGPTVGDEAVTILDAGAFADWVDRTSRFTGEAFEQGVCRVEDLLGAAGRKALFAGEARA